MDNGSTWVGVRLTASRPLRVLRRRKAAMAGLAGLGLLVLLSLSIGGLSRHEPGRIVGRAMEGPSAEHWLGTDDTGRDVFARIGHGGRVSLMIGLAAVGLSMLVGVPLGAAAGYFGGWTDAAVSRAIEVMLALPSILLAILIATSLGKGMPTLVLAVGLVGVPQFARQVRASVLSLRERDFVQASRALGASPWRTLFREVLPNAMGPIIVLATLGMGGAILTAAGLSFLGLGMETGTPEWGSMLYEGYRARTVSSHLAVFSGAAITLAVFSVNLFGDGLRDALDPRTGPGG